MSEWDRVAKYKPSAPPPLPPQTRNGRLKNRFASVWIGVGDVPGVLGMHHLRKGALYSIRRSMHDFASSELNHHTRFYTWDTSLPWNPDDIASWTPTAERPRDQWIPSY